MSLRFILGRSGSGKSSKCLNEIRERLKQEPDGEPIIYLVPEQMTFQSESLLTHTPELGGMIRSQVFSFTRLAWRVLQETGGIARYHLSTTGIQMVLRRIIENNKKHLKVFQKASNTNGFVEQMETMITEFKRYCVESEDLLKKKEEIDRATSKQPLDVVLSDKLHDFHLIYHAFERYLEGHYVDSEDYLQLLADGIPNAESLAGAEIYVDGFHSFTPQELLVLSSLMKHCKRVNVTLTLDSQIERENIHELDLFHMTASTYERLQKIALEEQVEVEVPCLLEKTPVRFEEIPSLAHLEQHYETRPAPAFIGQANVFLHPAVNRRAEVEGIARQIYQLVQSDGYRYRDIAILLRNSSDYHDLFVTIFEDYKIPIFLDQKQVMLNHPLIEFIRSCLDIIQGNWRYEAVFRALKTELLFPYDDDRKMLREEVDILENYALAYGVQGSYWKQKEPWRYSRFRTSVDKVHIQTDREAAYEKRLNQLRDKIVPPLHRLERNMKRVSTVREQCTVLYEFLEEMDIPKKLERLRDEAENTGRLTNAREHDQVWGSVVNLFDEIVEVMEEDELSFELFRKILDAGLESMRFSLVPPAIDQVLVGDIERSRFSHIKCTFIVGVNDGVLPAKPIEDGILAENEREALSLSGLELSPSSKRQLLDENFLIYLALSSASERLFISYPLANEEGKALVPSVLIKRISDLFPQLEEQILFDDPSEEVNADQIRYVTSPRKTVAYVATQMQQWKRGYPIASLWWDVYNWYVTNPEEKFAVKNALSSLFYRNEAVSLNEDVSKKLYGKHMQTSVSRMERYQACAFSQFASHGLRLKERDHYRLEAPDIGQLFHEALRRLAEYVRKENMDWGKLSKEDCHQLSKQMVEQLAPNIQRQILLSSNRYEYIKHKLQEVVERASTVLSEQARHSGFAPVGLELGFGKNQEDLLPPLQFTLPNGCTMEVIGRIDRVDQAMENGQGILLRIIDYKSSQKNLDLTEVYFGLALQMLTYLDVVITYAKQWLGQEADPAGVLYFHVHNPMLNTTGMMKQEDIEYSLFKEFKMKGLLTAEEKIVRLMDTNLESGHSDMIPVALTKTGGFYKGSSIASKEEFELLQQHVRNLLMHIGQGITDGTTEINPYKLNDKIPCTFCSYKSVCQFDQSLEENDYRTMKKKEREEIFEELRSAGEDDE
ncbi:helicase-exonuclease AddAB subunit AddB [Bacillus solimangrovi]|uniref:ATP-dependent helicase/deoxyribonuclease subunit B n=1 Tax=Bacillus solimangrovi TaxID=1305675 RepID=A0A1E5LED5_9BACI|nr:helicase-exonuclease AddAB subunit AddB [Bacillus solimangrovi]OEH92426.1 helicase-exonuclease AddAB subunit AddB [Bacillus solimangrovi]